MTEADRQQRIARALRATAAAINQIEGEIADLVASFGHLPERTQQLITLAGEFERARYLPKDDPLPDDTDADPEASPA